jgi:hypothetical protein
VEGYCGGREIFKNRTTSNCPSRLLSPTEKWVNFSCPQHFRRPRVPNMSNEKSSNLKRGVNAAFGEESDHKPKRIRRKKSKLSKTQPEFAQTAKLTTSNNTASNSQNERPGEIRQSKPGQKIRSPDAPANLTPEEKPKTLGTWRHLSKRQRKQKAALNSNWSLSVPEGGRFGDHDPILVHGDR